VADLTETGGSPPPWVPPSVVDLVAEAVAKLVPRPGTTLGITSTRRGEGRTTIAAASGIALAYDLGLKTLLVDLDLEKPQLTTLVGAAGRPGVLELVSGRATTGDCVEWQQDRLGTIGAGTSQGDFRPSLASYVGVMMQLLGEADVVVADLPPLPPHGAGARLASLCTQVLFVVKAGATTTDEMSRAVRALESPPPVIINRIEGAKRR
jgi:Mrp family chromosome partitioning ATPase